MLSLVWATTVGFLNEIWLSPLNCSSLIRSIFGWLCCFKTTFLSVYILGLVGSLFTKSFVGIITLPLASILTSISCSTPFWSTTIPLTFALFKAFCFKSSFKSFANWVWISKFPSLSYSQVGRAILWLFSLKRLSIFF